MRGQKYRHSILESIFSATLGFGVAVAVQTIIYPFYNIKTTTTENVQIVAIMTIASILRGVLVRRFFNYYQYKAGG